MAIAVGTSTVGRESTIGGTSLTFSHNHAGGTNDALLLLVVVQGNNGDSAELTATYNGSSMTRRVITNTSFGADSGGRPEAMAFTLVGAATGANDVVISAPVDWISCGAVAVSLTGVDQTTPAGSTDSFATATDASSLSRNLVTANDNSEIFGIFGVQFGNTGPFTPGSGYTEIQDTATVPFSSSGNDASFQVEHRTAATAGTFAVDSSWSTAEGHCLVSIEINEADTTQTIAVGLTTETDSALDVDHSKIVQLDQAEETDTGLAPEQIIELDLASETNETFSIAEGAPTLALLDAWSLVSTTTASPGTFTVSAGAQRLLVYVASIRAGAGQSVTAVTYGGQSMTLVETQVTNGAAEEAHESVWILDEAGIAAAANDEFAITRDDPAGVIYRAHAASYSSVDQDDPVRDSFVAIGESGTDPTPSSMATESGGVALAMFTSATATTADITWTTFVEQVENNSSTALYVSVARLVTTGASVTPSFTVTDDNNSVLIGLTLRPAGNIIDADQAAEADTAQDVDHFKIVQIDQAEETDTAQAVNPAHLVELAQGAEADTAFDVSADSQIIAIDLVEETDAAFDVTPVFPGKVEVDLVEETDAAFDVTPARAIGTDQAEETDAAFAIGHTKIVRLDLAAEDDAGLALVQLEERVSTGGAGGALKAAANLRAELAAMRAKNAKLRQDEEDFLAIFPMIAVHVIRYS